MSMCECTAIVPRPAPPLPINGRRGAMAPRPPARPPHLLRIRHLRPPRALGAVLLEQLHPRLGHRAPAGRVQVHRIVPPCSRQRGKAGRMENGSLSSGRAHMLCYAAGSGSRPADCVHVCARACACARVRMCACACAGGGGAHAPALLLSWTAAACARCSCSCWPPSKHHSTAPHIHSACHSTARTILGLLAVPA